MDIINNLSGNHYQRIIAMFENADTLYIISPFLMESFNTFFDKLKNTSIETIHLVTTLKSNDADLLRKANALHSFCSLCHTHGIHFHIYADNKLHGKIYIAANNGELTCGILTSANFTNSGLGLGKNGNHEWGVWIDDSETLEELLEDVFSICSEPLSNESITGIIQKVDDYRKAMPDSKPLTLDISIDEFFVDVPHMEYSETIWIKFEGSADRRRVLTERYYPHITDKFPNGVTCYSKKRKSYASKIKENDYVYIAVICKGKDEKGKQILPYIVGRGKSLGYQEGNFATSDMISKYSWMSSFPHYVPFSCFEYINAPIGECISLSNVLETLGSDVYDGTLGQNRTMKQLRTEHCEKAHLKLTSQARTYIDGLFDEAKKKHGVIKTTASLTQRKTNKTNAITDDMIAIAYKIAKDIYNGSLVVTQAKEMISTQSGMSINSTGDYIYNLRYMLEGKEYHRAISQNATRYYFENIQRDFGDEALKNALSACRKHVAYYSRKGGNLHGTERIIEEFSRKVDE